MAVAIWGCFEREFISSIEYSNPFQAVTLSAEFVSPSGQKRRVWGFWDGGSTWRVRFMPDEIGIWSFVTTCSDVSNDDLHQQRGMFECVPVAGRAGRFDQHGAVGLSPNRRYLQHANGQPFFWLGDTAWNGPLRSTDAEWQHYLDQRVQQGFSAVMWVGTEWISAPHGDLHGERAYTGHESITLNPTFFRRLDRKLQQINDAGLLGVPVLLWAAEWGDPDVMRANPGLTLPEDQAILLARYMVARWQGAHVCWILAGDGVYTGEKAERWQRIGRAVFGEIAHAPVMLHPAGMQWHWQEFANEDWLDIIAYQSCHFGHDEALAWITSGPPAADWQSEPPRPIINLEPPYENHLDITGSERFGADRVRRAVYWSLLNAPTAGVSYGGHGVWGWDDGTTTPIAHPATGVPLPWSDALLMPGAQQMTHLTRLFRALEWWRLEPANDLLLVQPGENAPVLFVTVAATPMRDLCVLYTPARCDLVLDGRNFPKDVSASWFDPRTGALIKTAKPSTKETWTFTPPGEGDYILVIHDHEAGVLSL